MGGDTEIGLNALEKSDHGLGVQAIEREAAAGMSPGLVGAFVEDAHQIGSALHHRDVSLVVNALKKSADVFDGVDVFDGAVTTGGESFFECLGGADVACSGRCGEKEDARLAGHEASRSGWKNCSSKNRLMQASWWWRQASRVCRGQFFETRRSAPDIPEIGG